ncbi:hypothetical protein EV363DRAFT_1178582, partial [Boletus edulis]
SSDLSTQIELWGLRNAGFNYNIVGVFGSQSTGKSAYQTEGEQTRVLAQPARSLRRCLA